MQTLYLGESNRISLATGKTVDAVKLSIITSLGSYVKDNGGSDIKDVGCTLDTETGQYHVDKTLQTGTGKGDIFVYWAAEYNSITVTLEDEFSPEDGVIADKVDTSPLLITPTYLMDNFLRGIDVSEIEETFVGQGYRSVLRGQIQAATSDLEKETLVHFTPHTIYGERHSFYMSEIPEKFWTVRLYHFPIVSVDKVQLKLNEYEIVENIPSDWIQTENPKDGMVSVIPYAGGVAAFVFRIVTQGGMGAALLFGEADHIPGFFSYDYKAGLDWSNLPDSEREDIKTAIGRQTAIRFLPNLDVHRGISSESKSADGISTSRSYTASAIYGEHSAAIETWIKNQKIWINQFKRKYLTRIPMDGYTP